MRSFLVIPIQVYRYAISPMMASHCRHIPTCSVYALEAIETHGSLKGALLAVRRVSRCHPWGTHGYDPVPGTDRSTTSIKANPTAD
ncbi:membrane protein insertion efficiency factor YidD [Marinobacter bryozoorum]|jgi:putative membrane protein insertion efficiency factor|uniref:membrane protein insertion efficiency factor YidD n=1 Tax=Marinobacter bryozoorum TaxID=256324 RepID=UPI00200448A5|nr:membrane protein insertion efficiency factor YidD [Marinobacter bryozoorum]MCK7543556.1 membrane protein insertion efficiency factor YidD [Marinobacter bryozoorum]